MKLCSPVSYQVSGGHLVSVRQRLSDYERGRPSGSVHVAPHSRGFSTALARWKIKHLLLEMSGTFGYFCSLKEHKANWICMYRAGRYCGPNMSIMAIKLLTSTDLIDIKSFLHSIIIKNISKNLLS